MEQFYEVYLSTLPSSLHYIDAHCLLVCPEGHEHMIASGRWASETLIRLSLLKSRNAAPSFLVWACIAQQ